MGHTTDTTTRGFTLLEVLVALFVLGIVVLALLSVVTQGQAANYQDRRQTATQDIMQYIANQIAAGNGNYAPQNRGRVKAWSPGQLVLAGHTLASNINPADYSGSVKYVKNINYRLGSGANAQPLSMAQYLVRVCWAPSPSACLAQTTYGPITYATSGATPYGHTGIKVGNGYLNISVTPVGDGAVPDITVAGPDNYSKTIHATDTLGPLAPGKYSVMALTVNGSHYTYIAQVTNIQGQVGPGQTATAYVDYTAINGMLAVTVSTPSGVPGNIYVTGPNGYATQISSTRALNYLPPGTYTVAPHQISANGYAYAGRATPKTVTVTVGASAASNVAYGPVTGAIRLAISGEYGLGNQPAVTIAGGRFKQTYTTSTFIANLPPDAYVATARPLQTAYYNYIGAVSGSPATVTVGRTSPVSVTYHAVTGSLGIVVTGPTGLAPSISVAGPGGYTHQVTLINDILVHLIPGDYTLTPRTITGPSYTYTAPPVTVSVRPGASAAARIEYTAHTGTLSISVSAPVGAQLTPIVTVSNPSGYTKLINAIGTTLIPYLTPSPYTINAGNVHGTAGSAPGAPGHLPYMYTPAPAAATSDVKARRTNQFSISYTPITGNATIIIDAPGASNPQVSLAGSAGSSKTYTLDKSSPHAYYLAPGNYTLKPRSFSWDGFTYQAGPQAVQIKAGYSTTYTVRYAPVTGGYRLTINKPQALNVSVGVNGPTGHNPITATYHQTMGVSASARPGSYTISPRPAQNGIYHYRGTAAPEPFKVTAGLNSQAQVAYVPSDGALNLVVSAPQGITPEVSVYAPGGALLQGDIVSSKIIPYLTPGRYRIDAANTQAQGTYGTYTATPIVSPSNPVISAGGTATATIVYHVTTGYLSVQIQGPRGFQGNVSVAGPNGYSRRLTTTATLGDLVVGTYTVTAQAADFDTYTYNPTSSSQRVSVFPGALATAVISYRAVTGTWKITVDSSVPPDVITTGPSVSIHMPASIPAGTHVYTHLAPGTYTLNAHPVFPRPYTYKPVVTGQQGSFGLAPGHTYSTNVRYTAFSGAVDMTVRGVPAGYTPDIALIGPGVTKRPTRTTSYPNMPIGAYTVRAGRITTPDYTYTPVVAPTSFKLAPGSTARPIITYTTRDAALRVNINSPIPGVVTITGPNNFRDRISTSATLTHLPTGRYRITAASVPHGNYTYSAAPAAATITLTAERTGTWSTTYRAATGAVALALVPPPNTLATITIRGASGSRSATSSAVWPNLLPGRYTVSESTHRVVVNHLTYIPYISTDPVLVTAGRTGTLGVDYAATKGNFTINVTGNRNYSPTINVYGPGGWHRTLHGTTHYYAVPSGRYSIRANNIQGSYFTYSANYTPSGASLTVNRGSDATATVRYAPATGTLYVYTSTGGNITIRNIWISGPNNYRCSGGCANTWKKDLKPGSYHIHGTEYWQGAALQTVEKAQYIGAGQQVWVNIMDVATHVTHLIAHLNINTSYSFGHTWQAVLNGPDGWVQYPGFGSSDYVIPHTGNYTLHDNTHRYNSWQWVPSGAQNRYMVLGGPDATLTLDYQRQHWQCTSWFWWWCTHWAWVNR